MKFNSFTMVLLAGFVHGSSNASEICREYFGYERDVIVVTDGRNYSLDKNVSGGKLCRERRLRNLMLGDSDAAVNFYIDRNRYTGPGLKNAKEVAGFVLRMFPLDVTKEPTPCGVYTHGDYKFESKGNKYIVTGSGDGLHDSCLDEGFPGGWDTMIEVTYDRASNRGRIYHRTSTE